MSQILARQRLVALRNSHGWSQEDLSTRLRFNDRQTLSEIERGGRLISPEELVLAAQVFGVPPDYLTDPMRLVGGEGAFSWRRKSNIEPANLKAFEEKAGGWIATYSHLRKLQRATTNSSLTRIAITSKSSPEDSVAEGEALARAWELGDIPAVKLPSVLEDKLDTLVLQVDPIPEVSGAACQLGPLNAILINRSENVGRRSFNLGHELFHLLTWSDLPPAHIDNGSKKVERLADCFASGILMPREAVEKALILFPKPLAELDYPKWIKSIALHLRVSGQALRRRFVELNFITKAASLRVPDDAVQVDTSVEPRPLLMSRRMMETLAWGLEQGHLSVRRCARILDTNVDDLADLFREYKIPSPFEI